MPGKKQPLRIVTRAPQKKSGTDRSVVSQPPTVSPRWLLTAIAITVLAAIFCAWGTLCLLFWQGSWQLLYHPQAAVLRTPASAGLAFDPVGFAATETGQLRLQGWWIPAAPGARFERMTVLYLHGANGNMGDSVDALARLHAAGVNVFAFDYRGYGQSRFAHPSEARWLEDAGWALDYLTGTRHSDPHTIVVDGSGLGANLAAEIAAAHPELAGVVLEDPAANGVSAIFDDPRAHLLPAHLLVRDRWDLHAAARALKTPSLWVLSQGNAMQEAAAYRDVPARKMLVWTNPGSLAFTDALTRWLDGLGARYLR